MIDTLNQLGVPDDKITVIIAVGSHRANTEEEFVEICGKEVCHRIRVVNHDAFDDANMVYLGRTGRGTEASVNRLAVEADRLIVTGGVVYHLGAGYGGGAGCAPVVQAAMAIASGMATVAVAFRARNRGSGGRPWARTGARARGSGAFETSLTCSSSLGIISP